MNTVRDPDLQVVGIFAEGKGLTGSPALNTAAVKILAPRGVGTIIGRRERKWHSKEIFKR